MNSHISRETQWHDENVMEIRLATELFPLYVDAQCYGPFGYYAEDGNYVITHLATGCLVAYTNVEGQVRTLVERLAALGDWESEDPPALYHYRDQVAVLIAETAPRFVAVRDAEDAEEEYADEEEAPR